jgi:hypothetical protein
LQTVRQLREFARGRRRSFRETEELLAFELDSFLAAFSEWPEEAKQRLTEALNRIRAWPLTDLRCKQLRKCVQKTYKRGRQALKAATEKTNTKNLHTFRKRAKELWYQLRILRPLAPAVFQELNDEQIRTWSLAQKDRWWLEKVFRGNMPQLTIRSALTGMGLGAILSLTNIYVGAKTGWTLGVGITSVILAFAMFKVLSTLQLANEFTILENNSPQSITLWVTPSAHSFSSSSS